MHKIIFIIVVIFNSFALSQNYGSWNEIDSLNIARIGHAMVVLPNGNVLVTGNDIDSIQSSCEIYELSTGKWRYTTPMNVPRTLHKLVLLNNAKVLAIGGLQERSCEVFDPIEETWNMTNSIPTYGYNGPTVITLSNGNILAVGGMYIDTTSWEIVILNKAEIYDPEVGKWIEVASMNMGRYNHTATLLNDGRLLVTGGDTENFQTAECEIYDPLDNTWTVVAPMLESRYAHAAILLNNGDVFISGGGPSAGFSCEVYNVATNQWQSADDILGYRYSHKVYYLFKVDKLFILGGDLFTQSEDTWEIYDPITLTPLYRELFPINQSLVDNNVQLLNENIMVAGSNEYDLYPIPHTWPSKKCWIFDVTTDVLDADELEKLFLLNQNYPNPFNPSTMISYNLQTLSDVELKVFDLLGNEVAMLVKEKQPAGEYKINFNANNLHNGKEGLSSGIYYYRITIKETEKSNEITFQQTKKMILLR